MSLGLFFGTWAVIAADIEDALGLGHGAFGALLAVALVGTVTTSMFTGGLVERFGTGVVLGWGAVAFAVAAAAVGLGGGAPVTLAIATVCRVLLQRGGRRRHERRRRRLAGRASRASWSASTRCSTAARPPARPPAALVSHATDEWRLAFVAPGRWAWWSRRSPAASGTCRRRLRASTTACCTRMRVVRREHLVGPGRRVRLLGDRRGRHRHLGRARAARPARGEPGRGRRRLRARPGAWPPRRGRCSARRRVASARRRGIALGSGIAAFGLVLIGVAPAVGAAVGLALAATGISVCWPMLLAYASQGREHAGRHRERRDRHRLHRLRDRPRGDRHRRRGGRACGPSVLVLAVIAAGVAIAPAAGHPAAVAGWLTGDRRTGRRCATRSPG